MSDHQLSVQVQSTRYRNRHRKLLMADQHMSCLARSCFSTHVPKLHKALYRQAPPCHLCMSDRLYVYGQTDPHPFTTIPCPRLCTSLAINDRLAACCCSMPHTSPPLAADPGPACLRQPPQHLDGCISYSCKRHLMPRSSCMSQAELCLRSG